MLRIDEHRQVRARERCPHRRDADRDRRVRGDLRQRADLRRRGDMNSALGAPVPSGIRRASSSVIETGFSVLASLNCPNSTLQNGTDRAGAGQRLSE